MSPYQQIYLFGLFYVFCLAIYRLIINYHNQLGDSNYLGSLNRYNKSLTMNRTTKPEFPKPQERKYHRTLKRCHLCQKMFTVQKFGDHFSACYASTNQKIEQSRIKSTFKTPKPSHKQIRPSLNKANTPKIDKLESDNKFRIKQVSNPNQLPKKNQNVTESKKLADKRQIIVNKKRQQKKQQHFQKVQANKKEAAPPKKQQQKKQPQHPNNSEVTFQNSSHNPQQWQNYYNNESTHDLSPQRNEMQNQRMRQESESSFQPFEQIIEQPQADSPEGFSPAQRHQTMFSVVNQFPQLPPSQHEYDIQDLIRSTTSIIEFVNSMNIRGQDETLNIMVAQLEQLNLIAEQITQLNSLGRALAIRMVNIFASRIHQLQTTIINQIGIALMRGFNERIGAEFQNIITQIHPDLRAGFSLSEIDHLFSEKISMTEKQCSICLAEIPKSQIVLELQCCHIFHPDCIKQWLSTSKKCPLCRKVQQEKK